MPGILPATSGSGGILAQFAERRPRVAEFVGNNSSALMQFGMGLLSGRSRSDAWRNAASGIAYGAQADQARRQRTKEEEEQARQEEAVGQLLMSPEFAEAMGALSPAEQEFFRANPEMAREFALSEIQRRATPMAAEWETFTDANGLTAQRNIRTGEVNYAPEYAQPQQPETPNAPETRVLAGPDGLPHTFAFNPATGNYDLDQGVAASAPQTVRDGDVPEGFAAVDRAYAPDYVSWTAAGGYADVQRQMNELQGVISDLNGGVNITGPIIGMTPDLLLNIFNPEAVDARNRVEEVVQRNLRAILGAQFTQVEGERLIARAFNTNLPDEVNAQRLQSLLVAMDAAAKAKEEAAAYFRQNGTLWGWQGALPSVGGLEAAMDAPAGAPAAAAPPAAGGAVEPYEGMVIENDAGERMILRNGQWVPL